MKGPLRIAVDASSLLTRHPRGEGRSLLRLYRELAQIRPEWRFVFLGTRRSAAAEEIRRLIPHSVIRTFDLPGYRWNLWKRVGLPMAAWLSGAKLLHCSSSGSPPWSPLPIVMTVHDVIPLLMDDGMKPDSIERFRRGLAAGAHLARKIITVSENTRQDLIRLMHPEPGKISVIHWGTDIAASALDPAPHRCEALVLGFGGGGSIRKNTPMLIRMFGQVAAIHRTARLAIIGVSDASQRVELETLAEQLSLQDRITLLDYVPDTELEAYYRRAACLVYVSLYEGFGLPPLEAMARGVPVVASKRSSVPEVVGDAGILVDPERADEIAAAVLKVLDDESLRHQLSERAFRRARTFTWRATAEQTASVFEAALIEAGTVRRG